MRRAPRVLLVAPIAFDTAVGAAARNKVLGMARAIRAAGGRAIVVTTLAGPRRRRAGVPVVAAPALGTGPFRRVTAALGLLSLARRLRQDDRILLYNAFPEYIPLTRALARRGRPASLDLEDLPLTSTDLRERIARWALSRLLPATASRKIVAARAIAARAGLADAVAIYGTATAGPAVERFRSPRLCVHFGGSLLPETGLDLFRDAAALLAQERPDAPIDFVLTGTLPADARAFPANVTVATGADDAAYRAILACADVGLSLKPARGEMGQGTFPSKVVEIASAGMLLVSTRVSDVPLLFDRDTALFLDEETPRALADALLRVAADRGWAHAVARAGRARAEALFAPAAVGRALLAALA